MFARIQHILIFLVPPLFSIILLCHGHGMMCTPRQRGAYRSARCNSILEIPPNPVIDYCPHCLNGGSIGTVVENLPPGGWNTFDPIADFDLMANRAGICGDPKGGNDHMLGGRFIPYEMIPFVATWQKGSQVDFMMEIDTNHNGYFEFFICNLDACASNDIHGDCYKEGHCERLIRVPHPDCQNPTESTHFECGPIDARYPSRWFVPCRKTIEGNVGKHLVGGPSGTMRFQLLVDMQCEHCVVQWYWGTANSCAPPDFLEYFEIYNNPFGTTCPSEGSGGGGHRKGMEECGGSRLPEEFWSCADVKIVAADGPGTTTPPTTTEPVMSSETTTVTITTTSTIMSTATITSTTTTVSPATATTTTTTTAVPPTATTMSTTTLQLTTTTTTTIEPTTTTTTTVEPTTTVTATATTTTTISPSVTTTSTTTAIPPFTITSSTKTALPPTTTTTASTAPPSTATTATTLVFTTTTTLATTTSATIPPTTAAPTTTTRISSPCPEWICTTRNKARASCRRLFNQCKRVRCIYPGARRKYRCEPRANPSPVAVPSAQPCPTDMCLARNGARRKCRGFRQCKLARCRRIVRGRTRGGYACVNS